MTFLIIFVRERIFLFVFHRNVVHYENESEIVFTLFTKKNEMRLDYFQCDYLKNVFYDYWELKKNLAQRIVKR